MRKQLSLLMMALLSFSIVGLSMVAAVSVGTGVNVDISTEKFAPQVWMCDNRIVTDDATEPGRVSGAGDVLVERTNNYAFEGEQIQWKVLVFDKNGVEKLGDVFATLGPTQGAGNDIEANCKLDHVVGSEETILPSCNAKILEEQFTHLPADTAAYYTCTLTVETPQSMYGEYYITVEAKDLDELSGTFAENEYWFLNPSVALNIDGALDFSDVRPGTSSYSNTILVGNDADQGSGVMMDMFVTGTDFYDSASSGAKCPTSNVLKLDNFAYYATSGAYSTKGQTRNGGSLGVKTADAEGYLGIPYGIGFNNPDPFYGNAEIIPSATNDATSYSPGNVLAPGAEMAVTFRLNLPEPCNGDFNSGQIYFWGEAV